MKGIKKRNKNRNDGILTVCPFLMKTYLLLAAPHFGHLGRSGTFLRPAPFLNLVQSLKCKQIFASKVSYNETFLISSLTKGFLRSVSNPCGGKLKAQCVGALDFFHSKCHLCLFKCSAADKPCRYQLSQAAAKLTLRGEENCLIRGWQLGREKLVSLQSLFQSHCTFEELGFGMKLREMLNACMCSLTCS